MSGKFKYPDIGNPVYMLNQETRSEETMKELTELIKKKRKKRSKRITDEVYQDFRFYVKHTMIQMICILMDLDVKDYTYENGSSIIIRRNPSLGDVRKSFIFSKKAISTKEKLFKLQYSIILLTLIINNLDEIIDWRLKHEHINALNTPEKSFIYLTDILTRLSEFIDALTNNGSYEKSLVGLYELISLREVRREPVVKHKYIKRILNRIRSISSFFIGDEMALNELFGLAYSMATDKTPDKTEKYLERSVKSSVKKLGKRVMKVWENDTVPIFFYAYLLCFPLEFYHYDVNSDSAVQYGSRCLSFVKFLLNDRRADRLFDRYIFIR